MSQQMWSTVNPKGVLEITRTVNLTVYGFFHPLQSCIGCVHVQSKVIQLLLAELTEFGLLFEHLTAQDLIRKVEVNQ